MADATRNLEMAKQAQETAESLWDRIATSKEFKDLMATKRLFIVPAFIFFVLYYFALPVLVGYAPQFMGVGAADSLGRGLPVLLDVAVWG